MHSTLSIHGLPVTIRKSPRARRISLRVSQTTQEVELVYPMRGSEKRALAFLESKLEWIRKQIATLPPVTPLAHGQVIPVLGEAYTIHHIEKTRGIAVMQEGVLQVECLSEFLGRRVQEALKKHLKAQIMILVQQKSEQLGVSVKAVTLRETTSRWGSCTTDGRLSFCWRLVFAPYNILDYLVSHEVAHLKEMNHSQAFWRVVKSLHPQYEIARNWLKTHGNELYRYR